MGAGWGEGTATTEPTLTTQYGPRPDSEFTSGVLFVKTKNSNGTDSVGYYHHDHLGTPLQATDKHGNIVWSAQYNAFGKVNITTPTPTYAQPTIESKLRFPGQIEDAETGWYYNWHRYYDPVLGRYVTADPIGLGGGVNFYGYVGGDPVNDIDPRGLDIITIPIPIPVPGLPGGIGGNTTEDSPVIDSSDEGGRDTPRGRPGRRPRNLTPCSLYHLEDCHGEIVYIGITNDLGRRDYGHTKDKTGKRKMYECPECPLTMVPTGKSYNTREACEEAERKEIEKLRPIFNDRKNPDPEKKEKRKKWVQENCPRKQCR